MQDLNRAITADGLNGNWWLPNWNGYAGLSAYSGSQSKSPSNAQTFTETLASLEPEELPVENGTTNSALLLQQFQTETSFRSASSDSRDDSTDPFVTSNSESALPTAANPNTSAVTTRQQNVDEDVYVPSQKDEHPSADVHSASSNDRENDLPNSSSSEKPKHPRGAEQAHKVGSVESQATNSISVGDTVTFSGHGINAANTSAGSAQQGDLASEAKPTAGPPGKTSNSGSNLAFAVKIAGSDAIGTANADASGNELAQPPTQQPLGTVFSNELDSIMTVSGSTAANSSQIMAGGKEDATGGEVVPVGTQRALESSGDETKAAQEDSVNVVETPDPEAASRQPVKTVQVQITGTGNERVDLKLMEKAGALTISVRSPDGALTKALQQNLPELNNKLNEQEARTEWWTPDVHKTEPPAKSANFSNDTNNGNPGSREQGGQDKNSNGEQRGGGRSAQQPDWVEELSRRPNSNQNGVQFTWHL